MYILEYLIGVRMKKNLLNVRRISTRKRKKLVTPSFKDVSSIRKLVLIRQPEKCL